MDDDRDAWVMTDEPGAPPRGTSSSFMRDAQCKDCRREVEQGDREPDKVNFTYNEAWAVQQLDRGGSRSDRCPEHRQSHQKHIQGIAVAYVDLETVGQAIGADDETIGPTGPLGGLGPLPGNHLPRRGGADLGAFRFGMEDKHIRRMLFYLENDDQRVLVVKAGTGTGKSTFMPYRLLDPPEGCFRLCDIGPIIVTEPRVEATLGVAGFVGNKLSGADGVGPGHPVGYQVSRDRNHDSACQLIFATDGTVINWMREGRLSEIGTIIVDEAHERSTNIDFIMGFLKRNIDRYPHLRVIITSATFNVKFYREYFLEQFGVREIPEDERSPVNKVIIPAQKSIGYGFPLFPNLDALSAKETGDDIRTRWNEACPDLPLAASLDENQFIQTHWKTRDSDPLESHDLTEELQHEIGEREDLHETTRKLLPYRFTGPILEPGQWRHEMPKLVGTLVTNLVNGLDSEDIFGDVLAFLPTTNTIEEACEILRPALGDRADVYALLSSLSTEEKKNALDARKKGDKRKVVISSNLAETSLTVEGVRFVVDSGLICQQQWDPESASGALPTGPHSQSGIKQRWGRVGRKAPGWVFPLYTKGQFVRLPQDTPPASTRSNLESLVMTAKMGGIDNVADFPWPASFEPTTVELDQSAKAAQEVFKNELVRANEALRSSGAVDQDGDPTSFGKELTRFQGLGSTASAMAIMYADRLCCVPEVTTILALLESQPLAGARGLLADGEDWPLEWRLEAAERHAGLFSGCEDDAEAVLQIVAAWERADPEVCPWVDTEARTAFARSLWLNQARLVEMAEVRRDVLKSLSPAMKEEVKRFVEPALLRRARGAITRAMSALEYRRHDSSVYRPVSGTDDIVAKISEQSRLQTVADRVLPLSRKRNPATREHSLSNVVTLEDWATRPDDNDALIGTADAVALLVSASVQARPDTRKDVLAALLLAWPPGTRLTAAFQQDGGALRLEAIDVRSPAQLPTPVEADKVALDNEGDGEAVDADPPLDTRWPAPNDRVDDVEASERLRVVDTRDLEADAAACGVCKACLVGDPQRCEAVADTPLGADGVVDILAPWRDRATLGLDVTKPNVLMEGADPKDGKWYEVAGYDVTSTEEPSVILRPDWRRAGEAVEPGQHPDLRPGQTIELRVGELRHDLRAPVRVLYRTDGRGRFALREAHPQPDKQQQFQEVGASLDRRHQGLVNDLEQESEIVGTVIPTKAPGCFTVTLLELLHQHLVRNCEDQMKNHAPDQSIRARAIVTEQPNRAGYGKVELAVQDSRSGIRHQMSFRAAGRKVPEIDDPVSVGLQSEGAHLGLQGVRIDKIRKLAAQSERDVRVVSDLGDDTSDAVGGSEDKLQSHRPVSAAICRALEMLGPDEGRDRWLAEVWAFFARSHHLRVKSHKLLSTRSKEQLVDRPAELSVATQEVEDAIAELPADSTVKGYVVGAAQEAPVVNLTPSISIVVGEADREEREYEPGEPVLTLVRDVRPRWGRVRLNLDSVFRAEARLPPSMESVMRINRRRLASELGVSMTIAGRPPIVRVAASSSDTLDAAIARLELFLNGCSVLAEIPKDKKGLVLGKGASTLRSFQERPEILHCNFERGKDEYRLLIAADSVDRLRDLLGEFNELVYRAQDIGRQMRVPDGKNGRLIGRGGATVRSLREESGCTFATAINNGPVWLVKGPTEASIQSFVDLANGVVPGCRFETDRPRPKNLVLLHPATREPISSPAALEAQSVRFVRANVEPLDLGASITGVGSSVIVKSFDGSAP